MSSKQAVTKGLALAAELYGKQTSDTALKLWMTLLSDHDPADIMRAFFCYFETGAPFMPKPCDIVERIQGTPADRAQRAWSMLLHGVQTVGGYRTVKFQDSLIHACVMEMGGWQNVCAWTEKETPFRGQEFTRLYVAYLRQEPESCPARLRGRSAAVNGQSGEPTKTYLIGYESSAHDAIEHTDTSQPVEPLKRITEQS